MSRADVLFISKPVAPPWNDSSKNLVRDLSGSLTRHRGITLVRRGEGAADSWGVYPPGGGAFAPGLRDQVAVLGALGRSRQPLWHFFFAPNPRTSTVGRWCARLRGRRTVHTVCSAPREDIDPGTVLFADRTVVLSKATEARFLAAGVPQAKLRRIPPSVPPLEPVAPSVRSDVRTWLQVPGDAPLALYAGDLEVGGGAERSLELLRHHPSAILVMACRPKTPRARREEARLRAAYDREGNRTRWLGETDRILDLVGSADLLLLPSDSLYAKMDYPLVVLEAMAMGVPSLVCAGTPAAELTEDGGVLAAPPDEASFVGAALLKTPDELAEAGAAGRRVSRERYSPAAMARSYEAVYDELLER